MTSLEKEWSEMEKMARLVGEGSSLAHFGLEAKRVEEAILKTVDWRKKPLGPVGR